MGKYKNYEKKFQLSWLSDPQFSKWLVEVKHDSNKAYCKLCKTEIRAHKADLKKHASSLKHKRCFVAIASTSQKSIDSLFSNSAATISSLEIKLAAFVACHSSIHSIDHLGILFKNEMPTPSNKNELKIHRTKCTAIIKNVISPALLAEQVEQIRGRAYSLILDESTDIACVKHLCLCVRYYNEKHNSIISQYLGLLSITKTTAEVLYVAIKDFLTNLAIDIKDCFSIATDGASNLCGVNNSVFTMMKKENPSLILIKCICHSLHLACSHAADELPSNINYLLRETYNWFHRSALRCETYMELYKLINDNEEPLKLIPLSVTRWLARSNCVKRLLAQWEPLKLHFQMAASNCDKYYSRELAAMYSDTTNLLYLTFLKPVLSEFERINLLFQKEYADHGIIHDDLVNFTLSMLRRVLQSKYVSLEVNLDAEELFLPMDSIDFGYEFSNIMSGALASKKVVPEQTNVIQNRCFNFLKKACKELLVRTSSNIDILKKIRNFSPSICLSPTRPPFSELPLEFADKSIISDIENEWRILASLEWKNIFSDGIPTDSSTFWCKASTIKNAAGDLAFKNITEFALKAYSVPISNATVERVFSRVTMTKTKLRNRMGLELLSSILRIKMTFQERDICCHKFEPTQKMLKYDTSIYCKKEEIELIQGEEELLDSLQF